jgi:hypothetical protein
MIVYKDKFLSIDYFSDKNYILVTRTGTENITMQEYMHITSEWLNAIKKYKPALQLVDYSDLTTPIETEFQKYAHEHLIIPAVKVSVKKTAFIVSRHLFAQMSVEQIMSKSSDILEYKFFNDFNKAKDWLFQ